MQHNKLARAGTTLLASVPARRLVPMGVTNVDERQEPAARGPVDERLIQQLATVMPGRRIVETPVIPANAVVIRNC